MTSPTTSLARPTSEPVAVVLAGAGARGAFEAGAIGRLLPALADQGRTPTLFCGSSAGSINSVLLAAVAHLAPDVAAKEVTEQWRRAVGGSMIRSVGLAVPASAVRYAAGRLHLPLPPVELLDPVALRAVLGRWDGWDDLHRNIAEGIVDAVALTATDLTSDRTVVHVETRPDRPLPPDDLDRGIVYRRTRLGLEHVYASSCIPFLFPAVELPNEDNVPSWNVDGGVRLNVPLKPAIDLGAERLVVVATDTVSRPQAATGNGVPTAIDLADQLLHLATGDRLLEDLRTLTQVNQLVKAGASARTDSGRPYKKLPVLVAAPELPTDIAELVAEIVGAAPGGPLAPLARALTRVTGLPGTATPDLISFLLFLPAFTRRAVALGEQQADKLLDSPDDGWQE
jgi:NTE family protein